MGKYTTVKNDFLSTMTKEWLQLSNYTTVEFLTMFESFQSPLCNWEVISEWWASFIHYIPFASLSTFWCCKAKMSTWSPNQVQVDYWLYITTRHHFKVTTKWGQGYWCLLSMPNFGLTTIHNLQAQVFCYACGLLPIRLYLEGKW